MCPGNNIFIIGGGVTLMVGGNGNDQFYARSNNLFSGWNDIMIGGTGANYFGCGRNDHAVILDFNSAKCPFLSNHSLLRCAIHYCCKTVYLLPRSYNY